MRNPWSYILALMLLPACSRTDSKYAPPREPEEALKSFEIRNGFQIQLFASEPHVQDPVEMIFDEKGRIYVVEMPDYPDKPEPGKGQGRIRQLIDSNGDGRIDRNVLFADGLSEATSILPWKGGLIVTAAPNILYLSDTNADGKADEREVLFSGFFENNSEAQITNLRFNVDNWIYASNFGQPGQISYERTPQVPPLSVQGTDFRFRLDLDRFEPATGPTQFGQGIDDWGHRFVTHNTQHINHLVIPWRYLSRNPLLQDKKSLVNISDHDLRMYQRTEAPYWRAERTRRRQKRYDESGSGQVEYAADHFTGSSGGTVYDAGLFPEAFYGNVFTGDVAGNLVHRDVIEPLLDSPNFVARRAGDEQNREFLASLDPWFRPVSMTVGPDGALYVIDMYRQHIETPLSIPEDLKADMDFYNGSNRGRIYRIITENSNQIVVTPNLNAESTEALINHLAHAEGWFRRTAHRLLVEREDRSAVPALRTVARSVSSSPQALLRALYVLEALERLEAEDVIHAIQHKHPGVREHGIQLSEEFPELRPHILALADDPSPRVVMQLVLSLGQTWDPAVMPALAQAAARFAHDPWMRRALLTSETGSSVAVLRALDRIDFFTGITPEQSVLVEEMGVVIGARRDMNQIADFLDLLVLHAEASAETWEVAALSGLTQGLVSQDAPIRFSPQVSTLLEELAEASSTTVKQVAEQLLTLSQS